MPEENDPPIEPESFWGPAPVLPPQPAYTLPPDPTTLPQAFLPPVVLTPAREYAGWGTRVMAFVADNALLVPWYVLAHLGQPSTGESNRGTLGSVFWISGYACLILFAFWNTVVRQGIRGATLGKSWLGIRVIGDDTGHEIGIGRSLVRTLLHVVNLTPVLLGYLWPLWDKKRQTFSDKITNTVVVHPRTR
jgi:uncharacterized RDD family membrane protein YckC